MVEIIFFKILIIFIFLNYFDMLMVRMIFKK